MPSPLRTELVAENTIFGTQQAVWKERPWGKSVLEENIRIVAFTTGRSQRMFCVGLYMKFFEWQASGTVLRLPARKLYRCRPHFSSACLVWMFCNIIWDHKDMWDIPCPFQCTLLQCASLYFYSYTCTAKNTEWDFHQNEKRHHTKTYKISYSKKDDFISSKIERIGSTWLRESNLFHHCRINFYKTQTFSSLLLAFTVPLATSVTVHIIVHMITDTTDVKPQWVKRFEVGRYTF